MKKKLITSALPYVNNVPHLGNIIGSVLSADVFARYCRLRGFETLYICGTDEFGTATEAKALEMNLSPKEVCDQYFEVHRQVYEKFNISFDYFGRTTIPEHVETTQQIFLELEKNDYILTKTSQQLFCPNDKIFLADRYVEGVCPNCGFTDARGDQCDNCSKLLQPAELIDARCKICSQPPQKKETSHLYIDLPQLTPKLKQFFNQSSKQGKWPENAIGTTSAWFEQGLQIRPISRDLKWGVPIPKENFENKVFYVWFDAVMGYVSFTKRKCGDKWRDWWLNPENVELYQFMAKDNIPFHTIIFPAMKLGSADNWTMLHHISSSEYLNYDDQKFSKSRQIGVFGTDIAEIDLPIDWWRFYLLANRPETADSSFNWHDFRQEINANFIDNIGNLLNRTATLVYNSDQPLPLEFEAENKAFISEFNQLRHQVLTKLDSVSLRDSLRTILLLGRLGNKYLQEKTPWKLMKQDKAQTMKLLAAVIIAIREIALLLLPYIPTVAEDILEQLNFKQRKISDEVGWRFEQPHSIKKPRVLFKKLDPDFIQQLHTKYGGVSESVEAFRQLNIVAAKITAIEDHPSNEQLSIFSCDIGAKEHLTCVSALKQKMQVDDLLEQNCLFLINLLPRKFDSVVSQCLLLTASHKKQLQPLIVNGSPGDLLLLDRKNTAKISPQSKPVTLETLKKANLKIYNGLLMVDNQHLMINSNSVRSPKILNAIVT